MFVLITDTLPLKPTVSAIMAMTSIAFFICLQVEPIVISN